MYDTKLKKIIDGIRLLVFDFDGVFTDNSVYVNQYGEEMVRCCRSDGIGLEKIKRLGIKTIVLSAEINSVVQTRTKKLGIECIQGCNDKLVKLEEIIQKMGISFAQVCFMGNDVNDLSCLKKVALPIVVCDAYHEIIGFARYQTKAKGGYGAVREVCDLFECILTSRV